MSPRPSTPAQNRLCTRRGAALAVVGAAALLASACGPGLDPGATARPVAGATAAPTATPEPAPAPMVLETAVVDGGVLAPTASVSVTARGGDLADVTLLAEDGTPVEGRAEGRTWTATGELTPRATYVLSATGRPGAGAGPARPLERRFTAGDPQRVQKTTVAPSSGATVGIGHPIVLRFDHPVAPEARAAAEKALTVRTSRPVGEASWHWQSDTEVTYRPRDFWPAHTHVDVDVDLTGVRFAPGTWGVHDRTVSFDVGRAQVVKVDARAHTMQVVRDGAVVHSGGVSLGKPGFVTRSGVKVVMSREKTRRMRSSTIGIDTGPDAYDLEVPYALRLTNSGEFIHGAPWNPNVGRANTSHGCTNLSLDDARWLYENSLLGDVVETTGTDRGTEAANGLGGVWNVGWADWVEGSAGR